VFHRFDWYREIKRDRLFTEDEYRRFYAAIVHHRTKGERSPKRLALFELLLASGLRLREAMFLQYNSGGRKATNYIDKELTLLVFQRHKTWRKSGTKRVPVTPEIQEVLDRCAEFRASGNPRVFHQIGNATN
jgi:integrase